MFSCLLPLNARGMTVSVPCQGGRNVAWDTFLRVGFLQVLACSRMLEGRQGRMDLVRRRCYRDEQSTEEEDVEGNPLECVGSFTLGSWKAREGLPFARNFPCPRSP